MPQTDPRMLIFSWWTPTHIRSLRASFSPTKYKFWSEFIMLPDISCKNWTLEAKKWVFMPKNVKLRVGWTNFDRPTLPWRTDPLLPGGQTQMPASPASPSKALWGGYVNFTMKRPVKPCTCLNEENLTFSLRRVHFSPKPLSKLRDFGRIYHEIQ